MLKTEQPSVYSRPTDYYKLWLEKKKEVKKLESNLLDSKKVIRTLHQKLTDILKSIRIFEANQELGIADQVIEESGVAYPSVLLADPIIASETEVENLPCNSQGTTTESTNGNCGQVIQTENAGPPREINPISVVSDSLPKSSDVQEKETTVWASQQSTIGKFNIQLVNEVKNEQCDATENRSSVISDQEFQTVGVAMSLEIQSDNIPPELTFEAEGEHHINNELKPNSASDFQVEAEVGSSEKPGDHGMLSMNVFQCFKSEPMEEPMQDIASIADIPNVPAENTEEFPLQCSWQVEPKATDDQVPEFIVSSLEEQQSTLLLEQLTPVTLSIVKSKKKKKKRRQFSIEEKLRILKAVDLGKKKNDVAKKFSISASTLSTILKGRVKIEANSSKLSFVPQRKRMRRALHEDVDEAVLKWVQNMCAKNIPLSGPLVRQKALKFACILGHNDFQASVGWLYRFLSRFGISL